MRPFRALLVAAAFAWPIAAPALAQCNLIVRDSFRLGERPHGGNGRLRVADIHSTMRDYWPQIPSDGTRWMSSDQPGVPQWQFALSTPDHAEVDPGDPFNETAFADAGATALMPFAPPAGAFTISATMSTAIGTACLGYSSSSATFFHNLEIHGSLYMTLDADGNWSFRANGNDILASGSVNSGGALNGGFYQMSMTYDPASGTVRGWAGGVEISPVPVTLARPLSFLAMETRNSWVAMNNLSVYSEPGPSASASADGPLCEGASLTLTASHTFPGPVAVYWRKLGAPWLLEGLNPDGTIATGFDTPTLHLDQPGPLAAGTYVCEIASLCGVTITPPLTLAPCCVTDFNADGNSDQDDVDALINAVAGGPNPGGLDPDLNADGTVDQGDVATLVDRISGGACP